MVLDTLARADRYAALHPLFSRAFAYLARDLTQVAPGRHDIDAPRLYVLIDHTDGRGREAAQLEAHQRHIDIQFTIEGHEAIGWIPRADCREPVAPFDVSRDVEFFRDTPIVWVPVPAGYFAIFFPDDAHAPLAGRGAVKKAIVKIAI